MLCVNMYKAEECPPVMLYVNMYEAEECPPVVLYVNMYEAEKCSPVVLCACMYKAEGCPLHSEAISYSNMILIICFCTHCDNHAKSSGWWPLASPLSTVVQQLAPRALCLLQCLLAKTVGVLSPGVGRSEECAQVFAPQSHIHSPLNQQDAISSDVFLAHSDQYADRRRWFGSSCLGC